MYNMTCFWRKNHQLFGLGPIFQASSNKTLMVLKVATTFFCTSWYLSIMIHDQSLKSMQYELQGSPKIPNLSSGLLRKVYSYHLPKTVIDGMSFPSAWNKDSLGTRACGKLGLGTIDVPSTRDQAPTKHLHPTILSSTQQCSWEKSSHNSIQNLRMKREDKYTDPYVTIY